MSKSYKAIQYSCVVYLCVGCMIDAALAAVGRLSLSQLRCKIAAVLSELMVTIPTKRELRFLDDW